MIRRTVTLVMALLLGGAVGAIGGLAMQDDNASPAPATVPTTVPSLTTVAAPDLDVGVLLLWTRDRLPGGLSARVAALPSVVGVAAVRGGTIDLTGTRDDSGQTVDELVDGWAIPLDAIAIDAASYATFLSAAVADPVRRLQPGLALLGSTSAGLRRIGPGGTVLLAGAGARSISVVMDDELVGAAELVLDERDPAAATLTAERYLLVSYRGAR